MRELTPQQLEKDVKRINERINEVVKLLGRDSEAYNKYVSKLKSLLPSQYVRVDKDGLFKIARKKSLYQSASDEKIQRAFEQILKVPTAGEIKAHAKKVIHHERKKKLQAMGTSPAGAPGTSPAGAPESQEPAPTRTPSPSREEVEDMARQIDRVEKFVTDNQDMFYVNYKDPRLNEIIHTRGAGRRSYEDLVTLIDAYQDKRYNELTTVFDDVE